MTIIKKTDTGFTLVELMIAIAIIGILSAIAYPSYRNSVLKTRRTDAKTALMTAAGKQESYFSSNNSYSGSMDDLGGTSSPEGYYTVSVANSGCSTTVGGVTVYSCFTLTAAANGGQADDSSCTTLTLTETGVKSPSDCW